MNESSYRIEWFSDKFIALNDLDHVILIMIIVLVIMLRNK